MLPTDEKMLTLPELARELRNRGRIDRSAKTLYRWARFGVKRGDGTTVRLEHTRLGQQYMSSMEAFERFALECS